MNVLVIKSNNEVVSSWFICDINIHLKMSSVSVVEVLLSSVFVTQVYCVDTQ